MGMLSKTADTMCGWQTGMVVLARHPGYCKPDASAISLISTLLTVGDAAHPMTEYMRSLDFREDQRKLSARVHALTSLGKPRSLAGPASRPSAIRWPSPISAGSGEDRAGEDDLPHG